jgi:hypothetical protein
MCLIAAFLPCLLRGVFSSLISRFLNDPIAVEEGLVRRTFRQDALLRCTPNTTGPMFPSAGQPRAIAITSTIRFIDTDPLGAHLDYFRIAD